MAKVTKFVYITIHVLSLFFITMNVAAIPKCVRTLIVYQKLSVCFLKNHYVGIIYVFVIS
ncbi:putative Late nodulin [Medicago truncatula]|uniref:Putative Late nodulin n=1 Tax=Medicago truncatula TaxID=3880 RepID=A0A396HQI7_MEDTR|nr:putative Late nodulin [Medicago truncatula]